MLAAPASQAALRLITAPAVELFAATDAAVTEMLHLDSTSDSTYLALILAASRQLFEQETGLCLITQTWQAAWDAIPTSPRDGSSYRSLSLSKAPLIALSSCTYLDEAGASQTFALSGNLLAREVGVRHTWGRAALEPDAEWPDLGDYPEALKIQFTAGFGAAATDVPQSARLAVLQLAAHWYEQRLPVNGGNIVNELPLHLTRLLDLHRIYA